MTNTSTTPVPTPTKPFYASMTFWTNVIALIASIGAGYGLNLNADVQAGLAGAVLAVVNIILDRVEKPAAQPKS